MQKIMTTMLATSLLVICAMSNVHAADTSDAPCPCKKKRIVATHHGRQAAEKVAVTTSASRPGHRVAGHPITTAHSRAGHRSQQVSVEKKA